MGGCGKPFGGGEGGGGGDGGGRGGGLTGGGLGGGYGGEGNGGLGGAEVPGTPYVEEKYDVCEAERAGAEAK